MVLFGQFAQWLVGEHDVAIDMLHLPASDPLVHRLVEGFLEASLEGIHTGVCQSGKFVQAVNLQVVGINKIFEFLILSNDGVEKGGQFLFTIIRAEQDEQFVGLQFVEMQAAQPVVEAVLQKDKVLVQPFADGQQGEVVFKSLGNELGQLLQGKAFAEVGGIGEVATDDGTRLGNPHVAAAVGRLQRHVAAAVENVLIVVGRDVSFPFQHEEKGSFVCVDDMVGRIVRKLLYLDCRNMRNAVVEAAAMLLSIQ